MYMASGPSLLSNKIPSGFHNILRKEKTTVPRVEQPEEKLVGLTRQCVLMCVLHTGLYGKHVLSQEHISETCGRSGWVERV